MRLGSTQRWFRPRFHTHTLWRRPAGSPAGEWDVDVVSSGGKGMPGGAERRPNKEGGLDIMGCPSCPEGSSATRLRAGARSRPHNSPAERKPQAGAPFRTQSARQVWTTTTTPKTPPPAPRLTLPHAGHLGPTFHLLPQTSNQPGALSSVSSFLRFDVSNHGRRGDSTATRSPRHRRERLKRSQKPLQ